MVVCHNRQRFFACVLYPPHILRLKCLSGESRTLSKGNYCGVQTKQSLHDSTSSRHSLLSRHSRLARPLALAGLSPDATVREEAALLLHEPWTAQIVADEVVPHAERRCRLPAASGAWVKGAPCLHQSWNLHGLDRSQGMGSTRVA